MKILKIDHLGIAVNSIKYTSKVQRPDGSSYNAFPSGHTATAFMNAEFLYQEYKHISPWYGVVGYSLATSVGALRMLNNRHWLTDVCAGAGIGILSTKMAYWVYPLLNMRKRTDKKASGIQGSFMPSYNGNQLGFAMALRM